MTHEPDQVSSEFLLDCNWPCYTLRNLIRKMKIDSCCFFCLDGLFFGQFSEFSNDFNMLHFGNKLQICMSKNGGNILSLMFFPESIIFAFIFSPKHNKKILIIKHSKFKWKLASNYLCTCLHKIMYEWIKCQKGNSYSGLCV